MAHEPSIVSFDLADPTQVDKLGAKGAKLVEDSRLVKEILPGMENNIPVPDGFILSTDIWRQYHEAGDRLTDDLFARVLSELACLEKRTGRRFGDRSGRVPLVVAVRGGAPVSLPGAIGTILNVGLNDEVVAALIAAGKDESFALTTFLTAIRMYGEVVLEIHYDHFYELIKRHGAGGEGSLSVPLLRTLIGEFKGVLERTKHPVFPPGFETRIPQQLRYAIEGVLASWMAPTAVEARRSREPRIRNDMGTAVVIQAMVFGNRDDHSCLSGVFFSRNQRTGANAPVIEWAPKVQCDKIVSGKLRKQLLHASDLEERFPDIYQRLMLARERLEAHASRPLDIEFTVENHKLYLLQRRPLRMTFNGTVRAMWDFVDEGKTTIQRASMIINQALEQPEKVLREDFEDYIVIAQGEPVTDSADSGILAFGTEAALELAQKGEEVILLRKRPYGETDIAVNHPRVRGIIRCDGNTTGHEAVSAVAYSKPYLINMVDAEGQPLIVPKGEKLALNPASTIAQYIGKRVFVDGEQGIIGYTESSNFLEDRKSRKKLYVDWEFLRKQFDAAGYQEVDYETLLNLHYQWEIELDQYRHMEKQLKGKDPGLSQKELLQTFTTYLTYIPKRDWERSLVLKEVRVEDFDFTPPITYHGSRLAQEVMKILRTLMLCTTWCTHWLHEIMVIQAKARGETENDVIRDIFLKNRTMSMVRNFEEEGFHVMKVPHFYHLILASNFEYGQDLDKVQIGPDKLNYFQKEVLAKQFMSYLEKANPLLRQRLRTVRGEPPLGAGHARIISIGISIPHADFSLVCRYLRTFLDQPSQAAAEDLQAKIPSGELTELYHLDPFFAPYPELHISREVIGKESKGREATGDLLLAFGRCSYGEFDGAVYGKEDYEKLMAEVQRFEEFLRRNGSETPIRPWHFEVDPYRRHSVIAAAGIRFDKDRLRDVLEDLKRFLSQ